MAGRTPVELGELRVSVADRLGPQVARYAAEKIRALAKYATEPVLHARVRVSVHTDPAVARPVIAQGNLDCNGRLVRAQVAARTAPEAVDALHDVLRGLLTRLARHWEAQRGGRPEPAPAPAPGQWRHGSEPARRPDHFPRPRGERDVLRRKTFELTRCTVEEATEDMDLLGYRFHLFTETGSGQDSVLYGTPGGLRLAQVAPGPDRVERGQVPFTVSPQPAARLDQAAAVRRLDLSGQPFQFFVEPGTHRGQLLYQRYDGHYGLIAPAG